MLYSIHYNHDISNVQLLSYIKCLDWLVKLRLMFFTKVYCKAIKPVMGIHDFGKGLKFLCMYRPTRSG